MVVTYYPPFALIPRLACTEMTPVDSLPALSLVSEVAPMPFIVDDAFYEFAREHKLPDCSVSFLMKAGPWSARNSRSGFVPSAVLAEFSSDPDLVSKTLCAAGILRRVKGGVRIVEGCGLTVVNAKDVSRDIGRERAEAEERKAKWRGDKQRQRAVKQAGRRELIAAGVPGMSTTENVDVHRENPGVSGKPQVNGSDVQVDIPKTSTKTPGKTASDYQDQNQSSGVGSVGVDLNNARAREVPSPETLALVVAGTSRKLKRIVGEAEACRAIAEWNRRAEAAGEVIHDPAKFYPTCIRRERDLEAIIAPPLPAAPPGWLAKAPEPPLSGPGVHVFEPDSNLYVDACAYDGCGLKEKNARHVKQEVSTG